MKRLGKLWAYLTKPEVYWRFFSLALAIIFWLLASGDGTLGETERTVILGVQVNNMPTNLVLVDHPGDVRVRIRGLSPLINRGESSLAAYINLSGATEGTETYSVEVDAPLGVNVVSVMPQWVSVYTEDVAEANFPVTLAFLGVERSNIMTGLRPSPMVVTVKGPRSILEEVDHVVAYLGMDSELDLEASFAMQVLDAQGRSLDGLEVDPPKVGIVKVNDDGEE